MDAIAVRAQLGRLLASPQLRNSKRSQALLRHVVEASLEGALDRVKERVIGVEVFGRDPEYDTNQDSVVRNAAIEVRKRLAQYYLEPGHENEIRIGLPQGAYVPEFHMPDAAGVPAVPPARTASPRRRLLMFAAAAVLTAALALGWLLLRPGSAEIDRFWAPLLRDPAGVLVCVGQPSRLYTFNGPRAAELDSRMGLGPLPQEPRRLGDTRLGLDEVKAVGDRYLFFGDATCAIHLAAFLQSHNKPFRIRREASTPYPDLRGSPVVLIGIFNNRWTQRLTGDLRFHYVRLPDEHRDELRDRLHPERKPWVIPGRSREDDGFDDYAIVTRVFNSSTEKMVVAIAGVTQYGTQSAGDFITSPEYLHNALAGAPADWYRRNLQIVLKTTVVTGSAGPPQVMAIHVW